MKTERVFYISTVQGIKSAERFKARLENVGYRVTTEPHGFNGVSIKGGC